MDLFKEIGVIVHKEFTRIFTDKRLIFTTFILPALSIFIMYSIMGNMVTEFVDDIEDHKSTIMIQHAPEAFKNRIEDMEKEGKIAIQYIENNADLEPLKEQVLNAKTDLIVVFPKNFIEQVETYKENGKTPEIITYYNPGEDYSNEAHSDFLRDIFPQYEIEIIGQRLGDAKYANVFDVDQTDPESSKVFDEKKAMGKGLGNLIPFILTVFLLSGAMSLGIDTIAGEKERGTMATLLVTPIRRESIAFGKIISLGVLSILSTISSLIGIVASMPFASKMFTSGNEDLAKGGMVLPFTMMDMLGLFLLMICLTLIFVGIICVLSLFSKSVKEAGTYVTPFYMVVMIVGVLTMFNNKVVADMVYLIPIYGAIMGIKALFLYQFTMKGLLFCSLSSIITVAILVIMIKNMFNDERVVFNQ